MQRTFAITTFRRHLAVTIERAITIEPNFVANIETGPAKNETLITATENSKASLP